MPTPDEADAKFDQLVWQRLTDAGATPDEIQSLMETWTAGIILTDVASERFGYDKLPIQSGYSRLMGFVDTASREFYASRRSVNAPVTFADDCYGGDFD